MSINVIQGSVPSRAAVARMQIGDASSKTTLESRLITKVTKATQRAAKMRRIPASSNEISGIISRITSSAQYQSALDRLGVVSGKVNTAVNKEIDGLLKYFKPAIQAVLKNPAGSAEVVGKSAVRRNPYGLLLFMILEQQNQLIKQKGEIES